MIEHDEWIKTHQARDHALYGRFQWTEKEEYTTSYEEDKLLEENNIEVVNAEEREEVVFSFGPGHSETWDMSIYSVDDIVEEAKKYQRAEKARLKARQEYLERKAREPKVEETPLMFLTKLALSAIVPAAVEYITGEPVNMIHEDLAKQK